MPDPPRDIGPIPDGSPADVHPDRDDPAIESEATKTQPSSDEESEETDRPEKDKTPEAKVTDLTEAVGTGTSKEPEGTKHDSATAKTATEIGKGAEPKLSGKENTADGKAGQPPIPPKKKAPPGWPIIDCSQSSAE